MSAPQSPGDAPSDTGRLAFLAYAALCAIWGSTWLAIRVLVHDVPPLWGAAVRFAVAAIPMLVWMAFRRPPLPRTRAAWKANLVLAVTLMTIPYGLLFWGEQHVTSSMTALLYSCMPLVVSLLTPFMIGRSVPRRAVQSMVVAVGGLAVLFYRGLAATPETLLGGLAVLAAMTFSGWSLIYARREIAGHDPVVSTGVQLVVGGHLLFLGSLLWEGNRASNWTGTAVLAILFLAIFGSAAAFALYFWLLRHMEPYQLSTIALVVPIIAIVEGWVFLGESIPPLMLLAAAVVLGAVASVLRVEEEQLQELVLEEPSR